MELGYVKAQNKELHASLAKENMLNLSNPQNYMPVLAKFFELNESNSRTVTLNHPLRLAKLNRQVSAGKYRVEVEDAKGNTRHATAFFKFSPMLDPLRYTTGRYGPSTDRLLGLPSLDGESGHEKSNCQNNAAYVDGFFSYLSAGLLHHHGFLHGLDSYACFLAEKNDFIVDVADDMDHLASSEFFSKHEGELFHFDSPARVMYGRGMGTGRQRPALVVAGDDCDPPEVERVEDAQSIAALGSIFSVPEEASAPGLELVFEGDKNPAAPAIRRSERDSSSCSSRSSGTEEGELSGEEGENDHGDSISGTDTGSDVGTISSVGEDSVNLSIKRFPVCAIALESCDSTLDQLMLRRSVSAEEWESAMFQVIVSLLAYKRAFHLTHNDLHTNNIMYKHTDKQYACYKVGGNLYKVPTHGRLYKIIDFGRAIYEYRGERLCSDSFAKHGDAATQYNCEPFMNSRRPRLDPNPSFDLCRLGCSLYDHLMDEYEGSEYRPPAVVEMMLGWCSDDKGRNIMYKANGVERYPDFKLYKMIARTVHGHSPEKAFEAPCMQRYLSTRADIGRKTKIMNLDAIPDYTARPTSVQ